MTSEKQFLADICESPDDLDARRVFADWLMERSDPWGELIATQLQLGGMKGGEKDYPELLAHSFRLQSKVAEKLIKPIKKLIGVEQIDYGRVKIDEYQNARFQNGFISQIAIRPEDIHKKWSKLSKLQPIDSVEMLVPEAIEIDKDLSSIALNWRRIKTSAEGWTTIFGVYPIFTWDLPKLESLDLSGCDLNSDCRLLLGDETGLEEYVELLGKPMPQIKQLPKTLVELKLMGTNIQEATLQEVLALKNLKNLHTLDVSQCNLSESATFDSIKALKKLKRLYMSGIKGDLGNLAGWAGLKKLECLSLPQTIEVAGFQKLFPKPSAKLNELHLSAAKTLLAEPAVVASAAKKLFHLNIGSTSVGDEGLAKLLDAKPVHSVVHLALNKCGLSEQGIESLVNSKLKRLVTLDVSSNKLTDASLEKLAESGLLRNVVHLRIRNNRKLTHAGLEALTNCDHFDPVKLDVGKCKDKKSESMLKETFGSAMVLE